MVSVERHLRFVALHWLFPVVIVGMILPIGLTAAFLAASGSDPGAAVRHGELFLAAGNAVVIGGTVLVASKSGATGAVVSIVIFAIPAYALWAFISSQGILDKSYSVEFAVRVGYLAAAVALIVSLVSCVVASSETE